MQKTSPLDRANSLFINVYELGCDFKKEKYVNEKVKLKTKFKLDMLLEEKNEKKVIDPLLWLVFRPRVQEIRNAAVSLVKWSRKTRHKKVVDLVQAVWVLCQKILEVMGSLDGQKVVYHKTKKPESLLPDSVRKSAYISFYSELCSLGRNGFLAVKNAKKDIENQASNPKLWETEIQSAKVEAQAVTLPNKIMDGLGSIDQMGWLLPNGKIVKLPKGRVLDALKALVEGKNSFEIPPRGHYSQLKTGPTNLVKVLMRSVNKAKEFGLVFPEEKKPRVEGRKLIFASKLGVLKP